MTRADVILVTVCGFAVGLLYIQLWTPPGQAQTVRIAAGSGVVHEYSLSRNAQFLVAGHLGDSEFEIRDGAVRFVSSPCRHKLCVRSGWHRRSGSVAACVPNRLSLSLQGGDSSEFDAINY